MTIETLADAMNKKFEASDKRFNGLIKAMNGGFERVDKRFAKMERTIEKGFNEQGAVLEAMDDKISVIAEGHGDLNRNIKEQSTRIDEIDERLEKVEFGL
jgi:methyl-accepting chemotaxis protein